VQNEFAKERRMLYDYTALIRYLEENEIIRTAPFDATFNKNATIEDLSEEKIHDFTEIARAKRAFPFDKDTDITKVLTHLNLIDGARITWRFQVNNK
jgi:predicted HTH transcriptional regulator